MLNVLLTIDTEISDGALAAGQDRSGLERAIRRDIFGETAAGEFGIYYQMELLKKYGLKAVFFVEALFASSVGHEPLQRIVQAICREGHEVQLHVHTEWLEGMSPSPLPGRTGYNIREFSEEEQTLLVRQALENLRRAGARNVCAFRAGNYGANFDTLRALASNGIAYDTSYNFPYLDSDCGLRTPDCLLQPTTLEGVCEVPISFFREAPGRFRHAQLCACSSQEMEGALRAALQQGWSTFVIVSHSFELLRDRHNPEREVRPDWIVIRRFERLCRFLRENRHQIQTVGFQELQELQELAGPSPVESVPAPLISQAHHTAWRYAEQLVKRVL